MSFLDSWILLGHGNIAKTNILIPEGRLTLGNTARAEILEGDVWRALKSSMTSRPYDFPAYCWSSLGLGNTARAEILGGDVWGAQESVTDVVRV